MAATLNQANYGTGVYGTARYGQYNVKPSGVAGLSNLDARPSNDMRFVAFSDQIVRAIYAGTKVYVDGSLHATLTNVGDTTTVSIGNQSGNTRPSKIITTDFPVSIAGNGNSLAAAPFSWSGTRFSFRDTRTNNSEIIVQAVRTETTVRIYKGTDTSPVYTLTAKTDEAAVADDIFGTYGSQTWSIEADDLIVVGVGAGAGSSDSFSVDTDILFPESTELFGHGGTLTSTDARTNSTGFTVTTFRSELGTTETDTLSTSNQNPGVSGRSTQYSLGNYTRSTASTPFSLFTIADADGGETTIAVGPEALCTEWTLPDEAEFLAIVAPEAADGAGLRIYNSSGTLQSSHSFSQTSGAVSGTPCALYLVSSTAGTDGVDGTYFDNPLSHTLPAGTRIVSDYPAFIVWEDENPDEDESILYGHGSFADPISGSAVNLVAKPAGVGATSAVGTLTVSNDSKIVPTGVAATGAVQTVAVTGFEIDVSEVLESVSATGAVGTVAISNTATLSGVSATASVGTVEAKPTEAITGVSATGSVGTVAISNTVTLSGVSATGAVGTLEEKPTEALTGVSATGSVGTVAISNTVGLTGVNATVSIGAAQENVTEKLTGVAGTTALGNISIDAAATATGVSATASVGTVEVQVTEIVTGVSATGAVGTLTLTNDSKIVPTGVAATGAVQAPSVGGLEIDITEVIATGVEATGAVNGVAQVNTGAGLTGVEATGAVNGSLTFSNTVTPTAVVATGAAGTAQPNLQIAATGVTATVATSEGRQNVTETPTGVAGTGAAGDISPNVGAGLTGVEATGTIASVGVGISEALDSVPATASVGTITVNVTDIIAGTAGTSALGTITTTAVVFDFEAIKEQYGRKRVVYVEKFTDSSKERRVYVPHEERTVVVGKAASPERTVRIPQENRTVYIDRFSTAAERRAKAA